MLYQNDCIGQNSPQNALFLMEPLRQGQSICTIKNRYRKWSNNFLPLKLVVVYSKLKAIFLTSTARDVDCCVFQLSSPPSYPVLQEKSILLCNHNVDLTLIETSENV